MAYSVDTDILLYETEAQLAILLGDPTGTTIDVEKLEYCIGAGDNEIDSQLVRRYKVPLDDYIDTPDIIRHISVDLALFRIYEMYYKDSEIPVTQKWKMINAKSLLTKLANGEKEIVLTDEEKTLVKKSETITQSIEAEGRRITNTEQKEFYDGII